jgi:hypothetical protein
VHKAWLHRDDSRGMLLRRLELVAVVWGVDLRVVGLELLLLLFKEIEGEVVLCICFLIALSFHLYSSFRAEHRGKAFVILFLITGVGGKGGGALLFPAFPPRYWFFFLGNKKGRIGNGVFLLA